jgi:hypothetical protein
MAKDPGMKVAPLRSAKHRFQNDKKRAQQLAFL